MCSTVNWLSSAHLLIYLFHQASQWEWQALCASPHKHDLIIGCFTVSGISLLCCPPILLCLGEMHSYSLWTTCSTCRSVTVIIITSVECHIIITKIGLLIISAKALHFIYCQRKLKFHSIVLYSLPNFLQYLVSFWVLSFYLFSFILLSSYNWW